MSFPLVAIAGGLGGIGRYIVDELIAQKRPVRVLSRTEAVSPSPLAEVVAVNYDDKDNLTKALQGVHTVISTIFPRDPEACFQAHKNLIDASVSAGVKRFAPSEWATDNDIAKIPDYEPKHRIHDYLKTTKLEYTLFHNGIFMDYFAANGETGYLQDLRFVVNSVEHKATIPGTGDELVAFTKATDVGKFVVAALELKTWPEKSAMASEVLTYNQVVDIAEDVLQTKFDRTYLSVDQLRANLKPSPAFMENFYWDIMIALAEGRMTYATNLNTLGPHVRPTTIREFLQTHKGPSDKRQ